MKWCFIIIVTDFILTICRYTNQLNVNMRNVDIYGFFDPQSIQKSRNKKMKCLIYIQWMDSWTLKQRFIWLLND